MLQSDARLVVARLSQVKKELHIFYVVFALFFLFCISLAGLDERTERAQAWRIPTSARFWQKEWRAWQCCLELALVSVWVARHFLKELRQMGLLAMDCSSGDSVHMANGAVFDMPAAVPTKTSGAQRVIEAKLQPAPARLSDIRSRSMDGMKPIMEATNGPCKRPGPRWPRLLTP